MFFQSIIYGVVSYRLWERSSSLQYRLLYERSSSSTTKFVADLICRVSRYRCRYLQKPVQYITMYCTVWCRFRRRKKFTINLWFLRAHYGTVTKLRTNFVREIQILPDVMMDDALISNSRSELVQRWLLTCGNEKAREAMLTSALILACYFL